MGLTEVGALRIVPPRIIRREGYRAVSDARSICHRPLRRTLHLDASKIFDCTSQPLPRTRPTPMKIVPTKVLLALLIVVTSALPATAANQGTLPNGAISTYPSGSSGISSSAIPVKYDSPDGVARYAGTADGKALGNVEGENGDQLPADGTWTSSGNEFCYTVDFYSAVNGKSVNP